LVVFEFAEFEFAEFALFELVPLEFDFVLLEFVDFFEFVVVELVDFFVLVAVAVVVPRRRLAGTTRSRPLRLAW